jgi:hypothetical protein
MSRLLIPHENNWYEELSSVAYYGETEFENCIKHYIDKIFPDFYSFQFKKDVKYNGSIKRPDLAMLKKDYSDWWIIEAELKQHPLNHVKPQVETFINGEYNYIITADYIRKQIKNLYKLNLDIEKIRNLILEKTPKVMVIVDDENDEWENELKSIGANLCTLQTFKAFNGNQAYRLVGNYPIIETSRSHCRYHKTFRNTLEIINPEIFTGYKYKTLDIYWNDQLTAWEIIEKKQKNKITFTGTSNPIPPNSEYVLIKDSQSKFYIKKV